MRRVAFLISMIALLAVPTAPPAFAQIGGNADLYIEAELTDSAGNNQVLTVTYGNRGTQRADLTSIYFEVSGTNYRMNRGQGGNAICSKQGADMRCGTGSLHPGSEWTMQAEVVTGTSQTGEVRLNIVAEDDDTSEDALANNVDTFTITAPVAEFEIEGAQTGSNRVEISVTNTGDEAATPAVVFDANGADSIDSDWTCNGLADPITCAAPRIGPGQTTSSTFTLDTSAAPIPASTMAAATTATDAYTPTPASTSFPFGGSGGGGGGQDDVDVTITMVDNGDGTVTITVVGVNNGTTTVPSTNLVVAVGSGLNITDVTTTTSTSNADCTILDPEAFFCDYGVMEPGDDFETIATATVDGPDQAGEAVVLDGQDEIARDSTTGPGADSGGDHDAELTVTVTDNGDGTVTVVAELENLGDNTIPDTGIDVTVSDDIDLNDDITTTAGSCIVDSDHTFECDHGDLPAGDTVTTTVTGIITTGGGGGSGDGPNLGDGGGEATSDDDIIDTTGITVGTGLGGVERLSDTERIGTAIAISQEQWPDGTADVVVLARADEYADALAGTPLAATLAGPVLLTNRANLADNVATEIQRVLRNGGTIYLLGGTAALDNTVEAAVAATGFNYTRLSGVNRYDTARSIYDHLGRPATVAYATGDSYPDAVVASAAMGHRRGALLLTGGGANGVQPRMPAETPTVTGTAVYAIGDPAIAVTNSVTDLTGVTNGAMSVAVAEAFYTMPTEVGIATDQAFPDALAGGAMTARRGAPLLLTPQNSLDPVVANYLASTTTITKAWLFGGLAALSDLVEAQVADAMAN